MPLLTRFLRRLLAACACGAGLCAQAQFDVSRIEIVRDSFGVPHIFAPTDAEAACGLAWAHCEDDFYTIQTGFLAAKGLLGRVAGPEGASVDFVVELIRARELVEARFDAEIAPDYLRVLEGYCAGFNRFAALHPDEVRHRKLLPLTPKDMAAYAMLQMFAFTGGTDALQDLLANRLPEALPAAGGSNAWAFNSRKTADGQVYLNINSHQPWEGIVAWYEAHLHSGEGLNIAGSLFPGTPHILHGCNEFLGWAHTVNNPDKTDVYRLEMHPTDKLRYRFDGQWLPLEQRRVKLKVRIAGLPVGIRKTAWQSVHGPVMRSKQGYFAIRSSGMFNIDALEQWYRMNKARNFSEFRNALRMEAIPGFNVVYADRYDTIYYLCNGKLPVRDPGYDWQGVLPGNTSRTLWTEFYPLDSLPQLLNPPAGYVFNTNNTPFNATAQADNLDPARFPATMGYETFDNNRSRRFMELLAAYDRVDYEAFKRIKYDGTLPAELAYLTRFDSLFLLDPQRYPKLAPLIEGLRAWDHGSEPESRGAVYFQLASYYVFDQQGLDLYDAHTVTEAEAVQALEAARRWLMKHYGTLDVTLGQCQQLVRGELRLPLAGLPDVLAAIYSQPGKDGIIRGAGGESYIELVRFTPAGPVIESVNVYGASNRPESPHYADQAELFVRQRTKRMYLDRAEVYRRAARVYGLE